MSNATGPHSGSPSGPTPQQRRAAWNLASAACGRIRDRLAAGEVPAWHDIDALCALMLIEENAAGRLEAGTAATESAPLDDPDAVWWAAVAAADSIAEGMARHRPPGEDDLARLVDLEEAAALACGRTGTRVTRIELLAAHAATDPLDRRLSRLVVPAGLERLLGSLRREAAGDERARAYAVTLVDAVDAATAGHHCPGSPGEAFEPVLVEHYGPLWEAVSLSRVGIGPRSWAYRPPDGRRVDPDGWAPPQEATARPGCAGAAAPDPADGALVACDFCGDADPMWWLPTTRPTWDRSDGRADIWGACDGCKRLLDSADLVGLAQRAWAADNPWLHNPSEAMLEPYHEDFAEYFRLAMGVALPA